jgi:MFS family permease
MDAKPGKSKGAISIYRLRTFDSFKVRGFRVFFASNTFIWLAGSALFASTLLLYRLTGSAFIVGAVALALCIPQALLSLFGGTIADRIQKKYVLIACRAGQIVVALIIGIALTSGYLSREHSGSWWLLMFAVFLNGIFSALMQPATVAIVHELVGRERLMNGISMNNVGMTVFSIIGPILVGFLSIPAALQLFIIYWRR